MKSILCIYYSRTGNTRQAAEELSTALEAELVEITDNVDRSGVFGFLKSGMQASAKHPMHAISFKTKKTLPEYDLVIVMTPIWAGRCASPVRMFLRKHGKKLNAVCYVVTRSSNKRYEEVYLQMDKYTTQPHLEGASLACKGVGYHFWLEDFLTRVRARLPDIKRDKPFEKG